jgi:PAS domain S-box-containing protein
MPPASAAQPDPSGSPVPLGQATPSDVAMLQELLDQSPQLAAAYDADLRLRRFNRAYSAFIHQLSGRMPEVGDPLGVVYERHPGVGRLIGDAVRRGEGGNRVEIAVPIPGFPGDHRALVRGGSVLVTGRDQGAAGLPQLVDHQRHLQTLGANGNVLYDYDVPGKRAHFPGLPTHIFGHPVAVFDIAFWLDVVHPDDRPLVAAQWTEAEEGQRELFDQTYRLKSGDGNWLVIAEQGKVFSRDGRVERVVGVMTDITDQQTAWEQLKLSDARYRHAIDLFGAVVWEWDLLTSQQRRVRPESSFLGYAPSDFGDSTSWWASRVHPEDLGRVHNETHRAIESGTERFVHSYRFARADGSYAVVEDRVRIFREGERATRVLVCMSDVSEQTGTQQSLARSEARYRTLVESAMRGIFRIGTDGRIVAPAPEICEYLGVAPEEVMGDVQWDRFLHPDEAARIAREWEEAMRTGRSYVSEQRLLGTDGKYRWTLVRAAAVRDEAGRIVEWIGSHTDIHDRKVAEQALAGSERQFRTLAQMLPVAIWNVSAETNRVDFANDRWLQLVGMTRAQLDAMADHAALIHPDDAPALRRMLADPVPPDGVMVEEFRHRLGDGTYRVVRTRSTRLVDQSGKLLAIRGTAEDVEEMQRRERQLLDQAESARKQREFLEAAFDSLPNPVLLVETGTGRVVFANRAANAICLSFTGTTDWNEWKRRVRVSDRHGNALGENRPFTRIARGERVVAEESIYEAGDQRRVFIIDSEPLAVEHGESRLSVMMSQEITTLKRVEGELRSASEAKDRFIAVLSHELRTPLTPVLTLTQILESDEQLPESARRTIGIIRRNVELETRLIDDLLDLTRISRGKLKLDLRPTDLRQVLRDVIDICSPDIRGKRLQLRINEGEAPLLVNVDNARLNQVFWNLLKNSIKFTPDAGYVEIELSRSLQPAQADTATAPEPGLAIVRVRDNGIGIPAHLLPRVFDTFRQGDHDARRYGGLGLGLAIARAIIEMHHGTLSAESPGPGLGAEFVAKLPLMEATASVPIPARPASSPAARSLRILLVEDHSDTARVLTRLLGMQGHVVIVADSVATAEATLRARSFDLLISDIGLPDGTGIDLMSRSRSHRPVAIALSGFGSDEDIRRSLDAGFVEHLVKPVDVAALETTIQRVTAGG